MPLSCLKRLLIFHWHQKGWNDICNESKWLPWGFCTHSSRLTGNAFNKSKIWYLSALLAPEQPAGALSVRPEQRHGTCPTRDVHMEKPSCPGLMPAPGARDKAWSRLKQWTLIQNWDLPWTGHCFRRYGRAAAAAGRCWVNLPSNQRTHPGSCSWGRNVLSVMSQTSQPILWCSEEQPQYTVCCHLHKIYLIPAYLEAEASVKGQW